MNQQALDALRHVFGKENVIVLGFESPPKDDPLFPSDDEDDDEDADPEDDEDEDEDEDE